MIKVDTEACANPACGILMVLEAPRIINEDEPENTWPVVICWTCQGYTRLGDGRYLGEEYTGPYTMAYPANGENNTKAYPL